MNGDGTKAPRARSHGGTGYNGGCRCEVCKKGHAERMRRAREARRARLGEATFTHGASAYGNWGCRCKVCTSAWTAACAPAVSRFRRTARGKAMVSAGNRRRLAAVQAQTLDHAVNHGKEWTGPELEIAARDDLTRRQIALMLGRSAAAVRTVRRQMRVDPRKRWMAGLGADPYF